MTAVLPTELFEIALDDFAFTRHDAVSTIGTPRTPHCEEEEQANGAHGNRSWSREENLHAQVAVFKFLKRHGVL